MYLDVRLIAPGVHRNRVSIEFDIKILKSVINFPAFVFIVSYLPKGWLKSTLTKLRTRL